MSIFKLGEKEPTKEMAESQRGPNTKVANKAIEGVLAGNAAETVHDLEEGHKVTEIGTFEGAETFYFAEDTLEHGEKTMYLG